MRIALAQINPALGNFKENADKIVSFAERAKARHCELVVFPESSLFGYHPMDLLEHGQAVENQIRELNSLSKRIPAGIAVAIGAFTKNPKSRGKPYFNSAIVLRKGKKPWMCHKQLLPTYDVFDDARHIEPGDLTDNVIKLSGKRVLVTVCEDIWAWPYGDRPERQSLYSQNPLLKIHPGSVDLAINLSASPFFTRKMDLRLKVTRQTVKHLRAPLIYVNMVGGQDELVFDGGSFALDPRGKVIAQCARFEEDLNVVDLETNEGGFREVADKYEAVRQALVLGIRDFCRKTKIEKVHLGLSGGIDSAVVACLAVDALGPENVSCYFLPGPFTSATSSKLAHELARNIGVKLMTIDFVSEYKSSVAMLEKALGRSSFGLMHENLQARFRAMILMAVSNREGSLLLNTSNKTEIASGYGTLYGDMCGGLSPIGDMLKGDVVELAHLYNAQAEIIPAELIEREPTAELRRNQKDRDSLPPYEVLDNSVKRIVEQLRPPRTSTDRFLLEALVKNEFKRWQFPPILKVREHSFGQGRRMPIAAAKWF